MAYTKYSLTPANNNAAPPDGAPEGMLPSAVNDTMRDMMAQIRDVGDGIRGGTYTMTAPVITGGSITGVALSGNTFTNPVITGGSINNTPIGATTANTGAFTTLSASGVATFSAGTVSAPAITTTGDTNTGIYFPAADTIAFTEGGVEAMRIDSSGNVGIGTSSPASRLNVSGGNITVSAGNGIAWSGDQTRIFTPEDNVSGGLLQWGSSGILRFNAGTTERMRIDSSGNVGIGTSSPAFKFDVVGNANNTITVASQNSNSGTSATARFLAISDGGNAQIAACSTGYTDVTGASDSMLLNANNMSNGIVFGIDGVIQMKLDASGNVGIGTSSPTVALDVNGNVKTGNSVDIGLTDSNNTIVNIGTGATGNKFALTDYIGDTTYTDFGLRVGRVNDGANGTSRIQHRGTGGLQIGAFDAGSVQFLTQNTERMRIDSSGNVGIGTSSPANPLAIYRGSSVAAFIDLIGNGNTAGTSNVVIGQNADDGGYFWNRKSSFLSFGTSNTERMRITSGGRLLLGTTTTTYPVYFKLSSDSGDWFAKFENTNADPFGLYLNYSTATPNSTSREFIYCADSSAVRMTVRSNGGIANYQGNDANLSDEREKTNIQLAGSYLDKICAIPVKTFNYIDQNREEDDGLTLGVIAQDVQKVAPELIMESDWGTEDNPKMRLSIYQTDLQYALMKCIQEQQAMIDDLKAEVALLKSK